MKLQYRPFIANHTLEAQPLKHKTQVAFGDVYLLDVVEKDPGELIKNESKRSFLANTVTILINATEGLSFNKTVMPIFMPYTKQGHKKLAFLTDVDALQYKFIYQHNLEEMNNRKKLARIKTTNMFTQNQNTELVKAKRMAAYYGFNYKEGYKKFSTLLHPAKAHLIEQAIVEDTNQDSLKPSPTYTITINKEIPTFKSKESKQQANDVVNFINEFTSDFTVVENPFHKN